jgi:hypothetical protein
MRVLVLAGEVFINEQVVVGKVEHMVEIIIAVLEVDVDVVVLFGARLQAEQDSQHASRTVALPRNYSVLQ